jgi:hypothetical protein
MRTLRDLANWLESVAIKLPQQISNERAKKAAEIILADLVAVTPVDTTKAVSNWQIGLGAPATAILPPYAPGKGGATASISRAAALSVGKKLLEAKQPEQPVFISNPLPYIRRLNDGYSKQAPAGFVERAVLLGRLFAEGQIGAAVNG